MGLLYRELLADNLKNCEGFDDAYKRVSHFSNPYSAAGMRNLSRKFRKIYILCALIRNSSFQEKMVSCPEVESGYPCGNTENFKFSGDTS